MGTKNNFLQESDLIDYKDIISNRQLKRLSRRLKKQSESMNSNVTQIHSYQSANKPPLVPKTDNQKSLIHSIKQFDQIIAIGSAGTGKTYITAIMAADMLLSGKVKKIVLSRPNVPTGKSLGAFPGTIEEKMAAWLAPIISVLKERMGYAVYECNVKNGNIKIVPFEVIRGYSFTDSFVMIDESQNMDIECAKAIVTRIGEDSKLVLMGDLTQKDLSDSMSGLKFIVDTFQKNPSLSNYINIVKFTSDDIVRSGLTKAWVKAFERESK